MILIKYWKKGDMEETKTANCDFSEIRHEITIGTGETCSIRINNGNHISRKHATLHMENDDKYVLYDNHSANGTNILNGTTGKPEPVTASGTRLFGNDLVQIGDYIFLIEIPNSSSCPSNRVSQPEQENALDALVESGRYYRTHTAMTTPTSLSVRVLIDKLFGTDADLDAFLIDCFPDVKKRCAQNMERKVKVNLLLEIKDKSEILKKIEFYNPSDFKKHKNIIKYESHSDT